ncbi:MAG: translation initiation factor IF-2 N-terminal domain-containing protein, partial [Terracidiphilus sp.]
MSKVRINDLARELEVKPRAIIDVLPELGIAGPKTHSSSLEGDEAEKVRARLSQDSTPAAHGGSASSRHAAQTIVPKIDLSHISKPGDVLKAVLAKKHEEEEGARHPHLPARPAAAPPAKPAAPAVHAAAAVAPAAPVKPAAPPARPEPRKIVPQPRSAPPIIAPPPATPAIA